MLLSCYLINLMLCEKARFTVLKKQVLFIHSTELTPPGSHNSILLTSGLQSETDSVQRYEFTVECWIVLNVTVEIHVTNTVIFKLFFFFPNSFAFYSLQTIWNSFYIPIKTFCLYFAVHIRYKRACELYLSCGKWD